MPGLIRRTLLIGGAAAVAAGGVALWRRGQSATEITYGSDPRQVMDVTLPAGNGPHPVLMMIHGGAFKIGDKSEMTIWPDLTQAGIAVVRINYRLSGTAKWPAQGEDCLAAVVHLQREGMALGLDPARLVLLGQSAGAFLAVSTALSLVEVGLRPRGVVSLFGPMDFSTMDQDMATLGRTPAMGATDPADSAESELLGYAVGENRAAARGVGPIGRLSRLQEPLPPILIRHGDADPLIADLQAKRLREAWIAADPRAEVDYKLVPGAGHGGTEFETDPVKAEVMAFLQKTLA
ncbi:MAG: alpha/beta hydrolase [Tabrizicola sp.]|uniref:alpha/beta hydrolase n=1 Tax=Tabrizicola sp. TaxID=2005166 RepID=UPI002ABBC332|nr:alpha/beta hydrolase [Tabrizicola sp.]MDZ4087242.1 alpha/beta hydrolase [Tabrizicola sp.]